MEIRRLIAAVLGAEVDAVDCSAEVVVRQSSHWELGSLQQRRQQQQRENRSRAGERQSELEQRGRTLMN